MITNFFHKLILCVFIGLVPLTAQAIPTEEERGPDGDRGLLGESDRWAKITYENWWHNNEALKAVKQIVEEKKMGMRETAKKMAQEINGFRDSSHADLLMNPDGSVFDFDLQSDADLKQILNEIYLSGYVDPDGEVKIITGKQPVWKVVQKNTEGSFNYRTRNLLMKVSMNFRKSKIQDAAQFENIVRDLAESMLPGKMLENFNPRKMAAEVIKKAGLVQLGDGITCRPTIPQDKIFAEFANLGCDRTDETLFWSDPAVSNGYHPVFGVAFNKTQFQGLKEMDVDNVISRGRSEAITKRNQLHPSQESMPNPFQGCSGKIIPGLIVMGEQGRLTPYEDPTAKQLQEAKRISKNLRMLPSQYLRPPAQKVRASSGDCVITPLANFKFRYPARVILTQSDRTKEEREKDAQLGNGEKENLSDQTYDVKLGKLDAKVYDNKMKLDKKRLLEIARLKDENLRGRKYLNSIIDSYIQMEEDTARISQGMDQKSSIPQITELRQSIFSSIEECRWQLSQLHFRYDDLKQKEWEVLENILHVEREYIFKLMDQAAVRYRTTVLNTEPKPD